MPLDPPPPPIGIEDRSLPDGRRVVRVNYPNGQPAVRHALIAIMNSIDGIGLNSDQAENIQLVLAEVLNNIAEHGGPPGDEVSLALEIVTTPHRLSCAVRDGGPEIPPDLLKSATLPGDEEAYPDCGFGWFLIHALATELEYTRLPDCNELKFDICLGQRVVAM